MGYLLSKLTWCVHEDFAVLSIASYVYSALSCLKYYIYSICNHLLDQLHAKLTLIFFYVAPCVMKILAWHHWCWKQQPAKVKWMWMLNILPHLSEQWESWEVQQTIWLLTAISFVYLTLHLYISVGMGGKTLVLIVSVGLGLGCWLLSVSHLLSFYRSYIFICFQAPFHYCWLLRSSYYSNDLRCSLSNTEIWFLNMYYCQDQVSFMGLVILTCEVSGLSSVTTLSCYWGRCRAS